MSVNDRALIGREVAGYQIEDIIGKGGMAVVYLALDPRLNRRVALKILNPLLGEDDRFRQRFVLESRTVASIDHPNIIPIYEADTADDGTLYIAMRYVNGPDLRKLFYDRGPMPVSQVNRIFAQVAAALDTAHAHDLVHRDVKPANILIAAHTEGDHAYLTDFGITKHRTSISGLTQTNQFIGTPATCRPSRSTRSTSTAAATSTVWPAWSTRHWPGGCPSSATTRSPCSGRTSPRPPPHSPRSAPSCRSRSTAS